MVRPRRVRSATRARRVSGGRSWGPLSLLYSLYLDSCHVEQQVCGCLESRPQLLVPLHPCGSIPRLMSRFIPVFRDPENSREQGPRNLRTPFIIQLLTQLIHHTRPRHLVKPNVLWRVFPKTFLIRPVRPGAWDRSEE